MPSNGGRTGSRYERLRRQVIREETHCAWCGQPVNRSLSGMHPMGPTLDHRVPLHLGGALLSRNNATLMHRTCNTTKGNLTRQGATRRSQSRDW